MRMINTIFSHHVYPVIQSKYALPIIFGKEPYLFEGFPERMAQWAELEKAF